VGYTACNTNKQKGQEEQTKGEIRKPKKQIKAYRPVVEYQTKGEKRKERGKEMQKKIMNRGKISISKGDLCEINKIGRLIEARI
jgi:hypothetical protein